MLINLKMSPIIIAFNGLLFVLIALSSCFEAAQDEHIHVYQSDPSTTGQTSAMPTNLTPNIVVEKWESLFRRLFDNPNEILINNQVKQMLLDMNELEKTKEFKFALSVQARSKINTLAIYEDLDRDVRGEKLTPNTEFSLTQVLLDTFDIDANNCLEYKLYRENGLVRMIVYMPIHAILQENLDAQRANCWQRLMTTLEETSNWIGAKLLEPIDALMEKMELPDDKFIELAKPSTLTYRNEEKFIARAVATHIRDVYLDRSLIEPVDRINFAHEFTTLAKNSCSDLHLQTSDLVKRIMKWLSSISGDINAKHQFVLAEHYKLVNRNLLCSRFHTTSQLRKLVVDQLYRYDFWKGFEDTEIFKRLKSKLRKIPEGPIRTNNHDIALPNWKPLTNLISPQQQPQQQAKQAKLIYNNKPTRPHQTMMTISQPHPSQNVASHLGLFAGSSMGFPIEIDRPNLLGFNENERQQIKNLASPDLHNMMITNYNDPDLQEQGDNSIQQNELNLDLALNFGQTNDSKKRPRDHFVSHSDLATASLPDSLSLELRPPTIAQQAHRSSSNEPPADQLHETQTDQQRQTTQFFDFLGGPGNVNRKQQ